jgi:glycosyltransferase involved in cell wall biosynthesis/SAM-dependent methyltransferase
VSTLKTEPETDVQAPATPGGDLFEQGRARRIALQMQAADAMEQWSRRNAYYYGELARLMSMHVPRGSSVLHVGCGLGDTLVAIVPKRGLGIDLTDAVISQARMRHPQARLRFEVMDPESFELDETFDIVLIDHALADMHDIQASLECIRKACAPHTRLVLAYYNALWGPILRLASRMGLRRQTGEQNWLGTGDFDNLLRLSGFEVVYRTSETLLPKHVPGLTTLLNRFVARFWPFNHLCLTQLVVARPVCPPANAENYSCTVVIPTRNERGNIEAAVLRTPRIGTHTEIIFVDGNSTDGTPDEIQRVIAEASRDQGIEASRHQGIKASRHQGEQPPSMPGSLDALMPHSLTPFSYKFIPQGDGKGKGDAVRKGFAAATGDVLMILDADLTVPPEDLPRFFQPIVDGTAEFINGTRLVYPMEDQAMRFLNKLGNRFFSMLFTWLLGQRFRDTLCGTKVLTRRNYEMIAANRNYFGEFDPFGDFDLIFGAAKADFKIIEVPVRYRARTYGETNIHRFRHGWMLLKMSWVAFKRLKLR